MRKRFIAEERNAQASKHLAIVENELHYAELRCKALLDSYASARLQGDNEKADRVFKDLTRETAEAKELEERRDFLRIVLLDKKYANQYMYTDVQPWEVIEEKSEYKIVVRRMKSTLKEGAKKELHDSFVPGGFLGHFDNSKQEWIIEPDENGIVTTLRMHKDGYWYEAGCSTPFKLAAKPERYYDYNF